MLADSIHGNRPGCTHCDFLASKILHVEKPGQNKSSLWLLIMLFIQSKFKNDCSLFPNIPYKYSSAGTALQEAVLELHTGFLTLSYILDSES